MVVVYDGQPSSKRKTSALTDHPGTRQPDPIACLASPLPSYAIGRIALLVAEAEESRC